MGSVRQIIGALVAATLAHAGVWWFRLPPRVATHFDASGNPDGWMTRDSALVTYIGIVALLAIVFVGIGPLIRRFPADMVNVPDKEYWLAPERREETYRKIGDAMALLGLLALALVIGIHELSFRANLLPQPHLGNTAWIAMFVFLVGELVWVVRFLASWSVPDKRP